ncbi:acyl-CoA thioesterase [Xenorhabdus nematophila]|uniref:acyl-CoA thioesterase n=1 Tax=Xenorhabdus nematophila TaxID=628 RepID=UPI00032754D8|nr:thioesterase family protein [Xenorhabdus nematophila]CEF29466.1 Thioesterase superfamily protein [Xenorhabdus nematophila str. Websteri]KHD27596.1 4-hydroxybenzoyl-CoA thioesterase [Xenorhabdus nematophila]MBA0018814.1 acyl-CoA thioesterase [Xenorhabdus nematophila]MCB4426523.1 acyl-CoA thioesterase [Xenorhabdus nematophila]CCW28998.1 Thioesterase superfamily protein [Xenorhabdus nematophila F1]
MKKIQFTKKYLIRFSHCDPAGIVYFPQYLILTNWLVEDWFTEGLEINFAEFIGSRRLGLPIVKLECEFLRPSRQGDNLSFFLQMVNLGRSSLELEIEGHSGSELRLRSNQIMVFTSLDSGKAISIPDDIRATLNPEKELIV